MSYFTYQAYPRYDSIDADALKDGTASKGGRDLATWFLDTISTIFKTINFYYFKWKN